MSESQQAPPAAEMPDSNNEPTPCPSSDRRVEEASDPEIDALLDFEPCPRKREVDGAWTPERQREFIARLAVTGSPGRSAEEMGKTETGVRKLYRSPDGKSFRAAWDAAVELAARRKGERAATEERVAAGSRPPSLDNRRKRRAPAALPLPGQVLNEFGEYEDEESLRQRGEEAAESICSKLLRIRRQYLAEISGSAAKRAAFEILTELPIDWDRAANLEPQPDEPWRRTNQREPDMILLAESGWSMGEHGYGPDKKAEMRAAIDEYRASEGLEPINWEEDE